MASRSRLAVVAAVALVTSLLCFLPVRAEFGTLEKEFATLEKKLNAKVEAIAAAADATKALANVTLHRKIVSFVGFVGV